MNKPMRTMNEIEQLAEDVLKLHKPDSDTAEIPKFFCRIRCNNCDWIGTTEQLLTATSPFDSEDILTACPKCKSVEDRDHLCGIEGCRELSGMGVPMKDGSYVWLCHNHRPTEEERK